MIYKPEGFGRLTRAGQRTAICGSAIGTGPLGEKNDHGSWEYTRQIAFDDSPAHDTITTDRANTVYDVLRDQWL